MLQFGSVTVSYRTLDEKDTNPSKMIYDLYIQSLVRLLKTFSYFLILYSFGILVFRVVQEIEGDVSDQVNNQILWGLSLFLHILGIIVGLFGIRAVNLQSRRSSRNFFIAMVLLVVIYLFSQGYYLLVLKEENGTYLASVIGDDNVLSAIVYYLIITTFSLIFFTLKAYRFHILLSKLIIDRDRSTIAQSNILASIQEIN